MIQKGIKIGLIFIIRWYRETAGHNRLFGVIAPMPCKYFPSCSSFAEEAITKYGVAKGVVMSVKRIARCHPFAQGGWDPVQ